MNDSKILSYVAVYLRDCCGNKAWRDEIACLERIAAKLAATRPADFVQIPDPHEPESAPFTWPAEKCWGHRVIVTRRGRLVLDMSLAQIVLTAALTDRTETRLDLT